MITSATKVQGALPAVGVVCHFPPPPGGMPAQAEALVTGLMREGVRVVRIPTNLIGSALTRRLDRVRFLRTLLRTPLFLLRLICALPRIDILHALSGSGLSFWLFTTPSLVLGAAMGRRVVLHYHGGEAHVFFRRWPRAVSAVARLADKVVVPSRFLQDTFAEIGIHAVILPNICETDRFAFSDPPAGSPVLLVARHLEPIYNVGCALRAFAMVRQRRPDVRLIVAGGGSQTAEIHRLAEELGIANAVRFTGYVAHDRIQDLYREATMFVNSSNVDNFPISILEAYSSGLPVVTTAAGGIPLLVQHEVNGLLVGVGNEHELAAAIERLIADPQLRERLRQRAREDVRQYSWPTIYPRLRAIYDASPAAPGISRADSSHPRGSLRHAQPLPPSSATRR